MTELYYPITFIIVVFIISKMFYNLYSRKLDIEEFKMIANFNFKENKTSVSTFLNDFITDSLQDYIMYYIIPDSSLEYITKDKENEIRKGLTEMIMNRLSDSIVKKITICYSKDYFNTILAEKIFVIVSIYVADFNTGHDKVSDIKKVKEKGKRKLEETDIDNDW